MPEEQKARKRIIVEEISQETKAPLADEPKIEVSPETKPHIEPGIHEITQEENIFVPIPQTKSDGINALWVIIPGIFILGALLGGVVYYQKSASEISITPPTPIATPVLTPTPIATPEPEVNLSKYKIKVLNGSGISGEASRVKALLEKAGFTVSSTGNATNYNYIKSVIQAKSEVEKEFINKLTEALSENYQVDAKAEPVNTSSPDEVVVIIGSAKN